MFDVAIIGGGPGGATCAALCAAAGRRVLLLERSRFPREKVCGDCLNPLAWDTLEKLGVSEEVLRSPHVKLEGVRFFGLDGGSVRVPLPKNGKPELGITRGRLDAILLQNARDKGAEIHEETTLTSIIRHALNWQLDTENGSFSARELVAADGRNSSVARLLGLLPPLLANERIGLQTHFEAPDGLDSNIELHFLREGYAGLAPVGQGTANLCLVSRSRDLKSIKAAAMQKYGLPEKQTWRSITPLSRAALLPARESLWLVGDAARVVEPFTGEGIAYAIRSGAFCAEAILARQPERYLAAHRNLYTGRLWLNKLARAACLFPDLGTGFVRFGKVFPQALGLLTRKVVRS
jgi:menaquinone-9 beta-reductase